MEAESGHAVVHQCGGRHRGQPSGNRHDLLRTRDDPFGVSGPGSHDHTPADPARVHSVTDCQHLARPAATRHVRQRAREEVLTPAAAQQRVQEDDVGRDHTDDDLAGAGHGIGQVDQAQHVRSTERGHVDRMHEQHPSLEATSRPASNRKSGRGQGSSVVRGGVGPVGKG
ncbi:hypothetical protein E6R61_23975 [Streptomyces sp. LRa12]|nr:hypothetical protein E6R61_23975 [Streptomyces sp. LRa12]